MPARLVLLALALGCAALSAAEPVEALARLTSGELRTHDERMAALRAELDRLPPAPSDQSTERIGWHSSYASANSRSSKFIAIDLGGTENFDAVVLVPVNVPGGSHPGPGYGFPVRFRVEALDGDNLPLTLGDFTGADFPNPGNLPVVLETPGARGRHVRVTATRLFQRDNQSLFALGELMVLRGQRNLATGARTFVSDYYANPPTWHPMNATDSQSVLGPPIRSERVPGHGWHSGISGRQSTTKWVQLDFNSTRTIDEIRLYPARPTDFPPRRGFGFPWQFRVETSDSEDFAQALPLFSCESGDFPNPGENPVVIAAHGARARYVRVTASRLWPRDNDYVFALGEMQVFSDDDNIAPAATVQSLDSVNVNSWGPARLNDGFTSQGRLLNLSEWLRGLSRRREVLTELAALDSVREPLVSAALRRLGVWAVGALVVLTMGTVVLTARRRRLHRRELARLRQRIASDLHDEIGSNLGSISLLAQLAGEHGQNGERSDLTEIQRIAQETAESMRDIVWLIKPGARAAADLVARMREVAASLLADLEWRFEAEDISGPFTLEFERQVLLLYKEALHNIRKHSHACRVGIRLVQRSADFRLVIADDGAGFDPSLPSTGHGLASMQHRAGLLGATLAVESKPAAGTRLELHARLS
jgi:signal transduction histidine kinase